MTEKELPPPHQVVGTAYPWTAAIKKQKTLGAKIKIALFHPGFLSNRLFIAVMVISVIATSFLYWKIENDRMSYELLKQQIHEKTSLR